MLKGKNPKGKDNGAHPFRPKPLSPWRKFTSKEWEQLRAKTPLTLTEPELENLRGRGEVVSLEEVQQIYLPLVRFLNLHIQASQFLYQATNDFLKKQAKTPYIIGLAGSVAVGKSTTARILQALLKQTHKKVEIITTDGFLHPKKTLEKNNLMERKGFPESFNQVALMKFISAIKSGCAKVQVPIYSHESYDIVPNKKLTIQTPDVLIFEGLNVLQLSRPDVSVLSDFFDFSIYLDASKAALQKWYIARFLQLRETAFQDPKAYFHRYSFLSQSEAIKIAKEFWNKINLPNLQQNILPTRARANLVLSKGNDHAIREVWFRKL